jgi:hypothetical protein
MNFEDIPAGTDAATNLGVSLKGKFLIAMPSPLGNPVASAYEKVLTLVGANMIPTDMFASPAEEVAAIQSKYPKQYGRFKPANLSME